MNWLAIKQMPMVLATNRHLPNGYRRRLRSDVVVAQKIHAEEPPFTQDGEFTEYNGTFSRRAVTVMAIDAKSAPKVFLFELKKHYKFIVSYRASSLGALSSESDHRRQLHAPIVGATNSLR